MQSLKFEYTTDGVSRFELELYSDGERMTRQDLMLMGDYIHLLFLTLRRVGNVSSGVDVEAMIRDLMRGDDR